MQGLLSVLHPQLSPVNPMLQLQTPQIHCPRLRPEKIQISKILIVSTNSFMYINIKEKEDIQSRSSFTFTLFH